MATRPDSEDDGPVTVYLSDGNRLTYDRVRHNQSGMVTFYDVERVGGNRIQKGERADTFPRERIEKIEYDGFGDE